MTCTVKPFVRGMLESYEAAMDSLLKAKYISEVSVLSQNGADKISEFNNTACEYDRSKTIADMFEELVQTILTIRLWYLRIKNILTENWMRSVTDLENISHPRESAVRMLFSILIPRCEYMAIAPMGVIKAGAAYQPLDPTIPGSA